MFDIFHKLPVSHDLDDGKTRSRDVIVDTQVQFCTLLLEPQIHDGLAACGYVYLSPIQQNALPLALTGSSVIAHAKSGTGKTLIYVLPILNDFVKRKLNSLHCLVLAPTREIAKQIYDVFHNVARHVKSLQIEYFIGGTPIDMDVIKCMNCNIAIGAPGRIKHLIDLGFLKTANLEFLVLDEVDALFDHKEYAVEEIISALPSPKQLIVCTATFSSKVGDLVKSVVPSVIYTSADSSKIEEISNISNMLVAVKQYVAPVKKDSSSMSAMRKREKLVEILNTFNFEQCFIFVNYMTLVRSIYNHLVNQNFSALWICSDQNQSTRINTINKLKMNHCKILVTTDLAARGIDVHKVNLVINLGLPCPPEIYIHRMGRAGRYGSEGAVITILSEGEEMATFTKMMGVISTDPINLHVLPERIDADAPNFDVIRCLPTEGSISVDEFAFKRQMKDNQEKIAVKTHDKKAKKKKRNASNVSKLASQNIFEFASAKENHLANGDDGVAEETTVGIEEFSQSLADFWIAGEPTPEWEDVKGLFGSEDELESDQSFSFVQNPSAILLIYARRVKERNEFMDEQTMPCDVDQFLNALNRGEGIFDRHSVGLRSLIKEISAKIARPARQRLNGSAFASSFDAEQSEISSPLRRVDRTSLSQQLFDALIENGQKKNISRSLEKKNIRSWWGKCSGSFSLAEEFANAMSTAEECEMAFPKRGEVSPNRLSRSNQSADGKQIREHVNDRSQNRADCTRSLSDEFSRAVNHSLENGLRNSSTRTSSTDISTSSDHSSTSSDDAHVKHETSVARPICTDFNLSDQFLMAVGGLAEADLQNPSFETSPQVSPRNGKPCQLSNGTPSRDEISGPVSSYSSGSLCDQFSISIDRCDRESALDDEISVARPICTDFNLSDQILITNRGSLAEANSQNTPRGETSPQWSPCNGKPSQLSNGTPSRDEISGPVSSYSSGSLSDQISILVDRCSRESTPDKQQATFNCLEETSSKSDTISLVRNLISEVIDNAFERNKFTGRETAAMCFRNLENTSKSVAKDRVLSGSDVFRSTEKSEMTSRIPEFSDRRLAATGHSSGTVASGSIPNVGASSQSCNSVSNMKSQSNGVSIPDDENTKLTSYSAADVKFKPEPSLKSVLVPEYESKSDRFSVRETNKTRGSLSTSKSVSRSSESHPNLNQKFDFNVEVPLDLKSSCNALANKRSQFQTSAEPENRLAPTSASDCRPVGEEMLRYATSVARRPTSKNLVLSENVEPSRKAVPISSAQVAPGSAASAECANYGVKTGGPNLLRGDRTAAILPPLRSHVSGQRERKIWRHHFAFIKRQALS